MELKASYLLNWFGILKYIFDTSLYFTVKVEYIWKRFEQFHANYRQKLTFLFDFTYFIHSL